MPTATKLFAAIAFALLGYFTAEIVKPLMPEGTQFGLFSIIVAGIGALCGWLVMGGLTGRGYQSSAGSGIRTAITMAFWGLVLFSGYEMVQQSMKLRFDGPVEALQGMFGIAFDYARVLVNPEPGGVLLIGGALAGMLAEWAGRRWL